MYSNHLYTTTYRNWGSPGLLWNKNSYERRHHVESSKWTRNARSCRCSGCYGAIRAKINIQMDAINLQVTQNQH